MNENEIRIWGIHNRNNQNMLLENKVIAIGWKEMQDLTDILQDRESYKEKYAKVYQDASKAKIAGDAGQLYRFVNEAQIGDYVVYPTMFNREINIGILKGNYFYKENESEYPQQRKVEWIKNIPRTSLSQGALNEIGSLKSFFMIKNYFNEYIDIIEDENKKNIEKYSEEIEKLNINGILFNIFQPEELINDMLYMLNYKKNIILAGTPGVGKTHNALEIIKLMELDKGNEIDVKSSERVVFTQFHQNYGYEEFIEGITLQDGKTDIKNGIFKKIIDAAKYDLDNNYYIIIDEINRGNISKVFGELLMCIENDKRNEEYSIKLLYSNTDFYVPSNIYIIGTMNTADRSLALVDYALRRRFAYFKLEPAFDNVNFINYLDPNIKDTVIVTMKYINSKLMNRFQNNNFNIGHSYFIRNDKKLTENDLEKIFKYEIIPLIKEYFFDYNDIQIAKEFKFDNENCKIFNNVLEKMVEKFGKY